MAQNNAIIANGATASSAIEVADHTAGCFKIPSAFTGATVSVQISIDGTNFTEVTEEGAETNPITVTTNGTYAFPIKAFSGKFIRLVSAGAEGAERTISVFLRK